MVSLSRTIPALPVVEMTDAVAFYRDRLGFEVLHHDGGFDGVDDSDFGTRELATLDQDGNLVTFFQWASE